MALILIVDDDPMVRAIAIELLRDDRHAILEAADGAQALTLMERMPVDLVILDMLMPNVDGLETIQAMKGQNASAKILAISSGGILDSASLLRIAVTFGADAAMQKPLRMNSFRGAVNRLLTPQLSGGSSEASITARL